MTKHVLFSIPMALAHATAFSQAPAEPEGTLTVTPAFVTAFMDRGVLTSGLSFQPTVEYTRGGLGLELFCNFPISDKIPGTADPQVDLSASYTWDVVADLLTVGPTVLLSTFPRAETDEGFYRAICEVGVSFGCAPADGLDLSLDLWRDVVQKGGGWELGAAYSFPIGPLGVELSALAGRYDLSDTELHAPEKLRNYGAYYCAGVSFPFEFSKRSKLTVGWFYAKGANNYTKAGDGPREPNPDAIGRGLLAFGFSHSF